MTGENQRNVQGRSFTYSFPFWIFVDCSEPLTVKEFQVQSFLVRVYPLFRSGPANFLPMPHINATAIPFIPGTRPDIDPKYRPRAMAAIPLLISNRRTKPGMLLCWAEEWQDRPDPFPMDSIRIDIMASEKQSIVAQEMLLRLLRLLRIHSNQWWIGHSVHGLAGYLRNEFDIGPSGEALGLPDGRAEGRAVSGDERSVDRSLWERALAEVEAGTTIRVYNELVLDARYYASVGDFRRAVIDLAMGCEQAKDQAFERLWTAANPGATFRRGRVMSGSDFTKHIDRDLGKFGCSYRRIYPLFFDTIAELWDARGNIAHGREPVFRRAGREVVVDDAIFTGFASVVSHCIHWLDSL